MGIFVSKQEIDLDKNVKYDLVFELTCPYQKKNKCNQKDKQTIKKYLETKLYKDINDICKGEIISTYCGLQKLKKKDITVSNKYIVSINTKLLSINPKLRRKTSQLYLEDFQSEMLEVLQHNVSSGGFPLNQKIEKYFLFPQSIENLVNES
tara:strand:- start:66 stop:518 length:453 start_codon:yes stop_codon:yes gene_type:complete